MDQAPHGWVVGTSDVGTSDVGTGTSGVGARDSDVGTGDSIAAIETELMKLVRHLETFARRTDLYVQVDRAGYLALRTLDDLGPLSVNALSDALHLDASTVTRQAATLEASGFVVRHRDPGDRRSSSIALTPVGRQVMHTVAAARRENLEAIVREWNDAERQDLATTINRLNASLLRQVIEPLDDLGRQRRRRRSQE